MLSRKHILCDWLLIVALTISPVISEHVALMGKLEIKCANAENNFGSVVYDWYHNKQFLEQVNPPLFQYVKNNVTLEDSGEYACVSKQGEDSSTIIDVIVEATVHLGATLPLTCGDQSPFRWYKNNTLLSAVGTDYTITVQTWQDGTTYTCVAGEGQDKHTHVYVKINVDENGIPTVDPSSIGQSPVSPSSVGQSPISQSPVSPSPVGQSPASPSPVGQSPASPSSVGQSPVSPSSVGQSPISQSPVSPSPVGQSPASPSPVSPSPVSLSSVSQSPVGLSSVSPSPVSLSSVSPSQLPLKAIIPPIILVVLIAVIVVLVVLALCVRSFRSSRTQQVPPTISPKPFYYPTYPDPEKGISQLEQGGVSRPNHLDIPPPKQFTFDEQETTSTQPSSSTLSNKELVTPEKRNVTFYNSKVTQLLFKYILRENMADYATTDLSDDDLPGISTSTVTPL